ncbi:uncharacterized protein EMH_0078590 [Eimeria mitis]|uniref:Uncharacterized protein n=1 Tax=Eimeria mitis TaxID=44415 RepID=U6K592_9EIME|nr:uncharacterized protein EMH_0078590 [Eimeria mitis]CDJ32910.1 hypothetical protein EMH_0078590 [Eimeria mitis]
MHSYRKAATSAVPGLQTGHGLRGRSPCPDAGHAVVVVLIFCMLSQKLHFRANLWTERCLEICEVAYSLVSWGSAAATNNHKDEPEYHHLHSRHRLAINVDGKGRSEYDGMCADRERRSCGLKRESGRKAVYGCVGIRVTRRAWGKDVDACL